MLNKLRCELVLCVMFFFCSFVILCACASSIMYDLHMSVHILMFMFVVVSLSITSICTYAFSICVRPILEDIRVLKDRSVRMDKVVYVRKTPREVFVYVMMVLSIYVLLVKDIEPYM